jgi:hypothetical protein
MGDQMEFKKLIKDKWPYLYFLILTIIIFSGFIFSSKMLFGSDTVEAGIFFRSFYADFVKTYHRVPLWDPHIFGGLPFVDAMHGDMFYPLAALQFFISLPKALGYKLVITVFLAGVFTYLYLRKMKMSTWSAVFGGSAYMLSGFLVSLVYAGHDGRMYVTSLMPLLLYTMEIALQQGKILRWWPFSLAFGLLILANHPQFAFYAMWCVGAYYLLRLIFIIRESRFSRQSVVSVAGFILGMAFGLCLALIQIWPTQDYVRRYSPRAEEGRGYEYAASWGLHAEEAVSQFVPGFAGYSTLGGHPPLTSESTYWGKNYFKINSEYAGLVVILLGIIGLFIYRDRFSWFFMATGIFALLYALGKSGLVFSIAYYIIPLVGKFRAPSTIMFLFCFSMSFLAARTVDQLEMNKKILNGKTILTWLLILTGLYILGGLIFAGAGQGIMRVYTSIFYPNIEAGQSSNLQANLPNITMGLFIGALLLGACAATFSAALRKKMSFGYMASVFIVLVLIDSWILNDMKFIRTVDPRPYFARPQVINYLESQPKPFRIFDLPGTLPNQDKLAQFGFDEVTGYHGNQLRWFDVFIGGSNLKNLGQPSVLALTNAEFILTRQQLKHPTFELAITTSDGISVYRNKESVKRGRIIYDYDIVADPDEALAEILKPSFDYSRRIIIDRAPQSHIIAPASPDGDSVLFLDCPPDRVRVYATLSAPGFLALQDNWYPYWKAYEGSRELPIFRTDYTFMSIELPAGKHEIEFRQHNPKYIVGKNVTLVSWLVLIAGLALGIVVNKARKDRGRGAK